jgi:hypothetical protein
VWYISRGNFVIRCFVPADASSEAMRDAGDSSPQRQAG